MPRPVVSSRAGLRRNRERERERGERIDRSKKRDGPRTTNERKGEFRASVDRASDVLRNWPRPGHFRPAASGRQRSPPHLEKISEPGFSRGSINVAGFDTTRNGIVGQ